MKTKVIALVAVMILSVSNVFASEFNFNSMNLRTNVYSRILPLNSLDGNLHRTQSNSIMQNGFLTTGPENFGYFTINLEAHYIGAGKRDKSTQTWYIIGSVFTLGFGGLGLPIADSRYELKATIKILDINKNVIKTYKSGAIFESLENIWDRNYTFKTEHLFRNILRDCLLSAAREADEINKMLFAAKYPPQKKPSFSDVVWSSFLDLYNSKMIPPGSKLAVISLKNSEEENLAVNLMEANFARNKFRVIERKNIDSIIAEYLFAGSVFTEENALVIGHLLVAEFIILASVAGERDNKHLIFKVLDVQSGAVVAISIQNL